MKIGLVGNQNSGKSTIFNLLTNSNQAVGNWAGVTVEKEEKQLEEKIIIDLPGIYSLNPYTEDEKITIQNIDEVDIIINVIDATNLERSLYLTLQLIDLHKPMIILLTMQDILLKKKMNLNTYKLSELLDLPVAFTYSKDANVIWQELTKARCSTKSFDSIDTEFAISKKYRYIDKVCNEAFTKKTISNHIDKILLNKWLSIPFFLIIMFLIYYLSFNGISNYISDQINRLIEVVSTKITFLKLPTLINTVINDGILNSIGTILSFIPSLTFLFFFIAILEYSGYMSRISFIMDKIFRKIGLSGKSIIPFIIGTSCSVPGILSARTIENKDEQYLTMLLTPLIPCTAKMTIIMMFVKLIFPYNTGIHIFVLYLISIFIIIILSLIFKKFIFKNTTDYFLNEITEYKVPQIRPIIKIVYHRVKEFIKRIGKTVIISSIILCLLYSFDFKLSLTSIDNSMLGMISSKLSFIFFPMLGTSRAETTIAIIQGLIAKEQVTSSLLVSSHLQNISVPGLFTNKIAMYSFLIFNLFCVPCINVLISLKKEIGLALTIFICLFQTFFSFLLSTLIYQVGMLIF